MKAKDVKIGETYVAKVSGKLTTVKILRESLHGGWDAENTATGRSVRFRTAGRLRGPSATPVGFPYRAHKEPSPEVHAQIEATCNRGGPDPEDEGGDAERGYELERKGDLFLTNEEHKWLQARRDSVRLD